MMPVYMLALALTFGPGPAAQLDGPAVVRRETPAASAPTPPPAKHKGRSHRAAAQASCPAGQAVVLVKENGKTVRKCVAFTFTPG
jgi:hypothetical protein